jgi:uncharacterized membrane protein YwaF
MLDSSIEGFLLYFCIVLKVLRLINNHYLFLFERPDSSNNCDVISEIYYFVFSANKQNINIIV